VDDVSKAQQRAFTAVGAILGLVAAYFVFDGVIGDRMIEAPRFVLAVLTGGGVGMIVYTLIKDGGLFLLKRQRSPKAAAPAPTAPDPEPEIEVDAPQRPLRAERPLRSERPLRPRE
jgi:hypothetical protein